jgi:repressor LexA
VNKSIAVPANRYYMLRANSDFVNLGINDGDVLLVRQETTAKHGDIVVALIDKKITIKEYKSTDSASNFMIQGIVVTTVKQ